MSDTVRFILRFPGRRNNDFTIINIDRGEADAQGRVNVARLRKIIRTELKWRSDDFAQLHYVTADNVMDAAALTDAAHVDANSTLLVRRLPGDYGSVTLPSHKTTVPDPVKLKHKIHHTARVLPKSGLNH